MVKEETSNATVNGKGSIAIRCEKEMTLISVGPIRFDSVTQRLFGGIIVGRELELVQHRPSIRNHRLKFKLATNDLYFLCASGCK